MKRSLYSAAAILAVCAAVPALAADYADLRPAYPNNWSSGTENPLRIESGIRYWYSVGEQEHSIGSYTQKMETKTSSGEAFVRIDDFSTSTYVEATGGYGIAHEGTYSTNGGMDLDLPAARLGYVGADFGWLPLATEQGGLGFVAGYQYTNDSPDTGRANFTTAQTANDIAWSDKTGVWSVGGDSKVNDFNIHALKLGLAGRFDAGGFDVTGEAAATPYAWVSGTAGSFSLPGQTATFRQASAATINGFGYGASGKLMVGFHPTDNFTIRVGGRASYLTGQYDATYDTARITPPVQTTPGGDFSAPGLTKQNYIINNNPFSMFRYGALVEVSGRF
ncbi:hypothetical protein [Devosia sp. 2618]|uniref:hypothetical protein n=1 Tax=Devosia sp. 2618 TaxID=3156454 RepID=UPI00339AC9D6